MDPTYASEVITRLHQAQREHYAGGSEAGVREALTPDVVWHVPGDNAIAGEYHGIDAVLAYFRNRRDLADSTFTMTLRELHVGEGSHVTALTDGAATISGVRRTWTTVGLYRIRGERIAECWLLPLDPPEFDSIWSPRRPNYETVATATFRTHVRPRHCDSQGTLHAARYYEYFEDAFLHWLDTHAGGYATLRASGADLVIVSSGCQHHRSVRLGDELRIGVRPNAVGTTSISMEFGVRNNSDEPLATGHSTYVAVSAEHGKIPLPDPLRAMTDGVPRR